MIKKLMLTAAALTVVLCATVPAESATHITTKWADEVDVTNVRGEYPRPTMVRGEWKNLNGEWDYAIRPRGEQAPASMDGKIIVPFCPESALSGVEKRVGEENELWYKRTFTVPSNWKGKDVILHFGAVDWKTDVWVNGIKVGSHTGGYTPFHFNITPALVKGTNTLDVRVWDPTDKGGQPRGKQVSDPNGIWYTPVSGIWQTVWLEPVGVTHIESVRNTPCLDSKSLTVAVTASCPCPGIISEVKVLDGGKVIATGKALNGEAVSVQLPADVKLWSPDAPNLYDLEIAIKKDGKTLDTVKSYFAMRKFSKKMSETGVEVLQLNGKNIFHFGPLDQGWWPDGLYTAPTYEAMVYDIDKTKQWGFNMIRKHIKVEPATWYAHCDRVGIIVWQDMPSGEPCQPWQQHNYFEGHEYERTPESEATYRKEWREIMDCLYNFPCIGVWVPFNEAWGQFKTVEITNWTKQYDPTRLVNSASGGNYFHCGDILDMHNYPEPKMRLMDAHRANVVGEYGGIGYALEGHLWAPDRNWGYIQFKSSKEVTDKYVEYAKMLLELTKLGVSGAVYTQTTDVEIEVNGFMTYDRKVVKPDEERIAEINRKISHSLDNTK
ncbi:MAG: glycoside hydrolase family 2 protein [Candidatus Limisoma sp.]